MKMGININELFKGVAVVIDDQVNDPKANIQKVLEQIISLHIPVVKYTNIPNEDDVSHFQSLSFVFLDWQLVKQDIADADTINGVSIPSGLEYENSKKNIEFIKKLNEICYCPVFIFTNDIKDNIESTLDSAKIYKRDSQNNIFIEQKSSLQQKNSFQKVVENWIKKNPSVYVLKEWEREYQKCKSRLFFDFQQMSPVWPQVMWKCFNEDGCNKSLELGELISGNLYTRMKPFNFNEDLLKGTYCIDDNCAELRKVLEGSLFLKEESLHDDNIAPGDLFYYSSCYFVNIRATCDLIPNRDDTSFTIDDVDLYLLKGSKLSNKKTSDSFNKNYGHFDEREGQTVIFPLHGGKAIDFRFKTIVIKKWQEIKDKRIGRILPPYITKIQQRFALYLHRQGLPRIPEEAIS
jgi:hypothetical protein